MKSLLGILLMLVSVASIADECEAAVDAAESMNVNARTDCNYEKSGLNRVVHQLFKKEQQSSVAKSSASGAPANTPTASSVSPLIDSAEQLAISRHALLSVISQECTHGFRITDELYIPVDGKLRLKLLYECL
jgi:hypothetical protein